MSHLILHKVRGQPAFDVAEPIGEDSDGQIWIIPTSGHRAYPSWWMPLDRITINPDDRADITYLAMAVGIPDSWPDHYSVNASPKASVREIIAKLIHKAPSTFKKRAF